MIDRLARASGILWFLTLLLFAPGLACAASDRDLNWYAGLYPQNPNWIVVQVDTRGLAANTLVKHIGFAVGFFDDTQDLLGGKHFDFTAGAYEALEAGNVYQRFFPNPFRGAASAHGFTLNSSLGAGGLQFAGKPHRSRSGAVTFPFEGGQPPVPDLSSGAELAQLGPTPPSVPGLSTGAKVFRLPSDAVANANGSIGPYCCTGRTVTVTNSVGEPVGYIYFYDFARAQNIEGNTDSAMERLSILLAVTGAAATKNLPLVQGAASFDAATWSPGLTRRIRLSSLTYTVTLDAEILNLGGRRFFRASSARAKVQVDGVN